MKLVMLESPYRSLSLTEQAENIRYARAAMHDSLQRGEAPFASHLLYTQEGILDDNKEEERSWGIRAGYEWGMVVDTVIFYTDRGWSPGMLAAFDHYNESGPNIELRSLGGEAVPPPAIIPSKEST